MKWTYSGSRWYAAPAPEWTLIVDSAGHWKVSGPQGLAQGWADSVRRSTTRAIAVAKVMGLKMPKRRVHKKAP